MAEPREPSNPLARDHSGHDCVGVYETTRQAMSRVGSDLELPKPVGWAEWSEAHAGEAYPPPRGPRSTRPTLRFTTLAHERVEPLLLPHRGHRPVPGVDH